MSKKIADEMFEDGPSPAGGLGKEPERSEQCSLGLRTNQSETDRRLVWLATITHIRNDMPHVKNPEKDWFIADVKEGEDMDISHGYVGNSCGFETYNEAKQFISENLPSSMKSLRKEVLG